MWYGKKRISPVPHTLPPNIHSSLRVVIKGYLLEKITPVLNLSPANRAASIFNYISEFFFQDYPPSNIKKYIQYPCLWLFLLRVICFYLFLGKLFDYISFLIILSGLRLHWRVLNIPNHPPQFSLLIYINLFFSI